MSRPQSQKLRPGNSLGCLRLQSSVAARASERAQHLLFPFLHWLLLVGGHHLRLPACLVVPGELRLLKDKWALQNHFHRCARRNHDIVATGKKSVNGSRSGSGERAIADSFGDVSRRGAANNTPLGTDRRSFEHIAHVAAFVSGLLYGALISLHLGPVGTGQTVEDSRYLNHLAVRKDHGGEVQVKLRPSFYPAWPHYAVNDTLHVNTDGNHDARVAHHRKRGNQVNAVSLLCGFGVDRAFEREQNLGSRRHGVGLGLLNRRGRRAAAGGGLRFAPVPGLLPFPLAAPQRQTAPERSSRQPQFKV